MAVETEARPADGKGHPAAVEARAIVPVGAEPGKAAKPASTKAGNRGFLQWLARHKGTILAVGLLVVTIVGMGWMFSRPSEVVAANVVEQEIAAEVEGTGTVTTNVLAKVGSKISGRIEKMLVQEGDVVKWGQIVAVLEDTDFLRQVDIARAELEVAKASSWEAKREWIRATKLLIGRTITQEDADVIDARQRVTEQTVQAREAQLAYAVFKLSETKMPTVVGGLVTKRWVEAGNTVVAGQPVLSVAETDLILVNSNVDQRFSGQVKKGQITTVILRGRTTEPFQGYVFRVYPQADPVTEEMLIQIGFPLPPQELQIGQWAEVYIEVEKAIKSLVVPKEAVMTEGSERFVFVAAENGRARKVKVQLGATSPRLSVVAVTGDLMAGEQVILMPMGFKGGERVRVKQALGKSLPGQEPKTPPMKMNMKM